MKFKYTVRTYNAGTFTLGFFALDDDYRDYRFESELSLEDFASSLAGGFGVENKWIMPGAIVWVKQEKP